MGYILSVYSTNAFKEFLLPAVNNADTSITIVKSIFLLQEDVNILLEALQNQWFFQENSRYSIVYTATKQSYLGKPVEDKDLFTITLPDGHILNVIVKVIDETFCVYQKLDISNINIIKIGKNETNDIQYDTLNLISKEHGIIRQEENQYYIEDTSSNGIFVNYVRLSGTRQLIFGDCIDIFGLRIVFLGSMLAINRGLKDIRINKNILGVVLHCDDSNEKVTKKAEHFLFHRSPRKICKLERDTVEIEAPPTPKEDEKQPLAMLIGPSLTMALPMLLGCGLAIYGTQQSGGSNGMFMYTGLVTAVASAIIGTVWSLINLKYSKKKTKDSEMKRFQLYNDYLLKCTNVVREKYENNTEALREMYPSAEECCQYHENTNVLWNRNMYHDDVLFQRLGIGSVPFQVTVEIPKNKFSMVYDALADRPGQIKESYSMLRDVPVGIDLLKEKMIGIFGGERKIGRAS